jgi:hypothetical protein
MVDYSNIMSPINVNVGILQKDGILLCVRIQNFRNSDPAFAGDTTDSDGLFRRRLARLVRLGVSTDDSTSVLLTPSHSVV